MVMEPKVSIGSCFYANLLTSVTEKVQNFNAPSTAAIALQFQGVGPS
jgi:hypothetical protein